MKLVPNKYYDWNTLEAKTRIAPDPFDIRTEKERQSEFLRILNRSFLIIGMIALVTLLIPPLRSNPIIHLTIVLSTMSTFFLIHTLNNRGYTRLAGFLFCVLVNIAFLVFFFAASSEIGLNQGLVSETPLLIMMGFSIIFAGALIHSWAAYVFAFVNSIILIVLINRIDPSSDPRPSIHVTWWLFALTVDLYERTLRDTFTRLQRARQRVERLVEERTGQLREAKDELEVILNNTSDAIILLNTEGDIQKTNSVFERLLGQQVSKHVEQILPLLENKRDIEILTEALLNVLKDGIHERVELQITDNKNAQQSDVDVALVPIEQSKKGENRAVLSLRDITHAKQLDRFKTQFVANATHDLSHPLAVFKTRLYMLKRSPEQAEDNIAILEDQVQRLEYLINDLRALSEVDRGVLTLNLEERQINDLIRRTVHAHEALTVDKDLVLRFIPDGTLPPFRFDSRKCERVITNLLTNAMAYTPEGGEVLIATHRIDEQVVITVTDNGMGIDAEDLPFIFNRFYRTKETKENYDKGSGLGLSIVKEMVEAHKGTVVANSVKGQGTTFTVRLPV